jgi:hypothetical protein
VGIVSTVLYYLPKPRWLSEYAKKLQFGTHPNANRQDHIPASWIRFLDSHR